MEATRLKKAGVAAAVCVALAAGWFGRAALRERRRIGLESNARLLLASAVKDPDAARAQAALSAYEEVVAFAPERWWPSYGYLFDAARVARKQAAADAAFARMTAYREARKAKHGSFRDLAWHLAARRYAEDAFEAAMVPRDKAINEGDERALTAASRAAFDAYENAVRLRKIQEEDLAGLTEPSALLKQASDWSFLDANARIVGQMRKSLPRWEAKPELARAHAVYLQGVNRYEAKDEAGAEILFRQARSLDPSHPYAAGLLSFIAYDAGREPEAAAHARAAIAAFAEDGELDEPALRALADVRGILASALYHEAKSKRKSRKKSDKAAAVRLIAEARAELDDAFRAYPGCGQCGKLRDELDNDAK